MDADDLTTTRRAYDRLAAAYAEHLPDTSAEAEPDLAMIDAFVAWLPAGASVLDAGCGTGRMLAHLRTYDAAMTLTGADLSAAMLTEASHGGTGAQLAVADLARLPFAGGAFDGVLAWYSIIHTPPSGLGRVLGEVRRVLRPGGLVLLGFQSGTGRREITRAYGRPVDLVAHRHGVDEVREVLAARGFAVESALQRSPRATESSGQAFVLARARP